MEFNLNKHDLINNNKNDFIVEDITHLSHRA